MSRDKSRDEVSGPPTDGPAQHAGNAGPTNSAKIAEDIGAAALELATRAHAAGLPTIGFLLESVALEAGTEAATRRWPADLLDR